MPVPVNDTVCRFLRISDWSTELHKPKQKSFKKGDMSVWHEGRLANLGATLSDLQFESLAGSGQLTLTVRDYLEIASRVSKRTGQAFQVQVEWRPEDEFVPESWRPWRDAHAQVEVMRNSGGKFPPEFRDLVIITAQRKNAITAPEPSSKAS